MCGIVACRTKGSAPEYLCTALEALEYRGYDSVGIALQTTDGGALRLRSTHRVAPPMMVFWGAPLTSGQYGSMP